MGELGRSISESALEGEQIVNEGLHIAGEIGGEIPEVPKKSVFAGFGDIFSKIFAPSIEKPVEEYIHHPLNFNEKHGTGRFIRGLEGVFDSLNYAIIDILLGLVEMWKERQKNDSIQR